MVKFCLWSLSLPSPDLILRVILQSWITPSSATSSLPAWKTKGTCCSETCRRYTSFTTSKWMKVQIWRQRKEKVNLWQVFEQCCVIMVVLSAWSLVLLMKLTQIVWLILTHFHQFGQSLFFSVTLTKKKSDFSKIQRLTFCKRLIVIRTDY